MSGSKKITAEGKKIAAENRRARFEYFIEETLEAGIILTGSEVKSIRAGNVSINESYAEVRGEEIFLVNSHIAEYNKSNKLSQHEPRRPRQLLLRKRDSNRLIGAVERKGITLVPLNLYFNSRGIAKVELAIAKGKKLHDKRETEKDRDWGRQKQRLMRGEKE